MADHEIKLISTTDLLHIEFGKALHNHFAYSLWRVPAGSEKTILLQDANTKLPVSGEVVAVDTKPDKFDVRCTTLAGQTLLVAFFAARYDGEPDNATFAIPLKISQPLGGAVLLDVDHPVAAADLLASDSFSILVK